MPKSSVSRNDVGAAPAQVHRRSRTGRLLLGLTALSVLAIGSVSFIGNANADEPEQRTVTVNFESNAGFVSRMCVTTFPGIVSTDDGELELPGDRRCTDDINFDTAGEVVLSDVPVGDDGRVRVKSFLRLGSDFSIDTTEVAIPNGSDDFEICVRITGTAFDPRTTRC